MGITTGASIGCVLKGIMPTVKEDLAYIPQAHKAKHSMHIFTKSAMPKVTSLFPPFFAN